jgi:hypothetical protein
MGNATDPKALAQAYTAVVGKLHEGDPLAAAELAGLREAMGKAINPDQIEALAQAYAAVADKRKEADPHAAEVLTRLREAFHKPLDLVPSDEAVALAQAYAAVATKLKEADPHAAEVLTRLRYALGETSPHLELAQAYAAVAANLKEADPLAAKELSALRKTIVEATAVTSHGVYVLAQAYATMAANLKDADPHAAEELGALREAIGKTADPNRLGALAQAYAAVAKKARPATAPLQDIALLLGRVGDLRSAEQCEGFVAAISTAMRLGSPPLSWQQAGLVVAAVLLQPISAGEPTRNLVDGYEKLLHERPDAPKPDKSWSGDVWAFANWARGNLPGFDPYRPNVGFLPSVALAAHN